MGDNGIRDILKKSLPGLTACGAHDAADRVIIAAAGFEDRAFALLKTLTIRAGTKVALVKYKDWADNNRVADIIAEYYRAGIVVEDEDQIEYDPFRPDAFAGQIASWLSSRAAQQVTVDISAMSRMAIMVTLDVCREADVDVTVFYAEAQNYGPSQAEYESAKKSGLPRPSIQVYSGVGGVVRATRLSSVALQGEPSAALAFMSMNELLTQALINSVYPTRLFLINGRPPRHLWREEATAWIHEQLRREWPERDNPVRRVADGGELPTRVTSTLEYIESAETILELYWAVAEEFRVILAPTGSKMQAVGSYIAHATHPDIHIEYPTPKGFLPNYSSGVAGTWMIRFRRLGTLVGRVRRQVIQRRLGTTRRRRVSDSR